MRFRNVVAAGAALSLITLAACAPRSSAPAPTPPPEPEPAPTPAPAPPPPAAWEDGPLSPGDWSYREGNSSSASFASLFTVRCDPSRQIALVYSGGSGNALIVRTTFGDRSLPATAAQDGLAATLAATDPLLDEMAFSRGRFAIETPGAPRAVLPAWPELARVVEDCRG